MPQPPRIPPERVQACIHEQYGLDIVTLDLLPGGLDAQALVYRVEIESGTSYLLKASSRSFYPPSCLVPRYLRDAGVIEAIAPIPTTESALWVQLGDATLTLYPFIDGDSSWTGMTDMEWSEAGAIFKRIHQVAPPPLGFPSMREERFDAAEYAAGVEAIETQHVHTLDRGGTAEQALRSLWLAHQVTIHLVLQHLEALAGVLRTQTLHYVICHADLHPANLLRDSAGHVWVIDWDEVMLAPKERDFIFVKEALADGSDGLSNSSFFQGYGATHIDWIVLTYFRYERVLQDVTSYAWEVFLSQDELAESSRAEAAEHFRQIWTPGGTMDGAAMAAARLPPGLSPQT